MDNDAMIMIMDYKDYQVIVKFSFAYFLYSYLLLYPGRGKTIPDRVQAWSWRGEGLGQMQRSIFDVWVALLPFLLGFKLESLQYFFSQDLSIATVLFHFGL